MTGACEERSTGVKDCDRLQKWEDVRLDESPKAPTQKKLHHEYPNWSLSGLRGRQAFAGKSKSLSTARMSVVTCSEDRGANFTGYIKERQALWWTAVRPDLPADVSLLPSQPSPSAVPVMAIP